jgi:hypothetical protein
MIDPAQITLGMMVACARREVRMREALYAVWVAKKRISRHNADLEIACMQAIVATLERLKAERDAG